MQLTIVLKAAEDFAYFSIRIFTSVINSRKSHDMRFAVVQHIENA